jgi:carbamoyl-phosphate synthase large subunit
MKKIMITGVGGGVGQSVIKSLQNDYELFGVDSGALAVGLHVTHESHLGKRADEDGFIETLLELATTTHCVAIFPGHDVELMHLAKNIQVFERCSIIPIVSDPMVIEICDDKYLTYCFLNENDFPVPYTQLFAEAVYTDPVIIKPRRGGARSKNVYYVDSKEKFNHLKSTLVNADYIVQEYIEGDEYTCGSITLDEVCYGTIVMKRILRDGDTYKAFVEHPSPLENYVKQVVEALKPFGACNVQLRVKNGIPYVFEINARCSGTTASRTLAGFNEPKMILEYLFDKKIPEYTIKNINILRYLQELIVDTESIETLNANEYLTYKKGRLL